MYSCFQGFCQTLESRRFLFRCIGSTLASHVVFSPGVSADAGEPYRCVFPSIGPLSIGVRRRVVSFSMYLPDSLESRRFVFRCIGSILASHVVLCSGVSADVGEPFRFVDDSVRALSLVDESEVHPLLPSQFRSFLRWKISQGLQYWELIDVRSNEKVTAFPSVKFSYEGFVCGSLLCIQLSISHVWYTSQSRCIEIQ